MARSGVALVTDGELLDAYARGMSPRKLAGLSGLSHQGVRNRLTALGVELRGQAQTAALQQRLRSEEHGNAIRETFLRTLNVERTAKEVGVSTADVRAYLSDPNVLPDYKVLAGRPKVKPQNYSDADLIASLQEAASQAPSSPLTVAAYIDFHRSSPTLPDGRQRPGHQTMMRVGTWGDALRAAALPANPPGGPLSPNDPVNALLSLVACWRDLGKPPTVADYDQWQRGKEAHPGSKTARKLVGPWPLALIRAWQVRYGIELDQTDIEIAVPPDLKAHAASSLADYDPANEETQFRRHKQELESGLEQLAEAVRNHSRLQNRLAELLKAHGRVPQSPASPPAFDLAFTDHDGAVVVVEVKSATPVNVEGQLRIGLGQILRYADLLRKHHDPVRPAILIQLEPSEDWKALLDELGVALLYEEELTAGVEGLLQS